MNDNNELFDFETQPVSPVQTGEAMPEVHAHRAVNAANWAGNTLWRHKKFVAAVAGLGFAASFLAGMGDMGVHKTADATTERLEITEFEPVALDCRVLTTTEAETRVERGLDINAGLFNWHVPTSHIAIFDGEVNSLTCADSTGVRVEIAEDGQQTVHVDIDAIQFFSRVNEENSDTTVKYEGIASLGEIGLNLGDIAGVDSPKQTVQELDDNLVQASRAHAVNEVEQKCLSDQKTWELQKQVYEVGQKLAAQAQGIDPNTIRVVFEPGKSGNTVPQPHDSYEINKKYEYKINQDMECTLSPDAMNYVEEAKASLTADK